MLESIRYVINWGPPRCLLDYHQEIGRAGRDGNQSDAITYFYSQQLSHCEDDINCLYNSGNGSNSRLMWNDGQYLVFKHIADLFYSDQEFCLHTLPKLTLDHIVLNSYR